MQLLGLLSYTIVFILAQGTFMFFFFKMIGEGGALNVLFKWQKMLDYFYASKYTSLNLIGKALGDCRMCCCFWFAGLSFITYRWLCIYLGVYHLEGLAAFVWAWIYWGLAAFYSYWFVTKASDNGL